MSETQTGPDIPETGAAPSRPAGRVSGKPALAIPVPAILLGVALVGAGDWLFWGHDPGLSLVAFAAVLALAAVALTPSAGAISRRLLALTPAIAGCAAVAEYAQVLSLAFYAAGMIAMAAILDGRLPARLGSLVRAAALPVIGIFRLCADLAALLTLAAQRLAAPRDWLTAWILPLAMTLVFLALFAAANPVIESLLARIGAFEFPDRLIPRLAFWTVLVLIVWPFLRLGAFRWPALRGQETPIPDKAEPIAEKPLGDLVSDQAIRNTLLLCNGLFAIQTAMDIAYLWSGTALPDGMTYAEYAHRGAYPLVVTALLAGAFVIGITARRDPDPALRRLILLWLAQNVLLLGSSVLRLNLYVEVYSLTYLRVAAFIWMGVAAAGFVLLAARLAWRLPNRWLLGRTLALGTLVLYACCFVNFAALIAHYNIAHSSFAVSTGRPLDTAYLCNLGPHALPGVLAHGPSTRHLNCYGRPMLAYLDRSPSPDWRAWTFRDWRLTGYLETLERTVDPYGR